MPGSSVHGTSQTRILEWAAMPSSRGPSRPSARTHVSCISCIGRRILNCWDTREDPQYSTCHLNLWSCSIQLPIHYTYSNVLSESKIQLKAVPHLNLLGQTCSSHSLACHSGVSWQPTDTCCILFITTHFLFSSLSFVAVIYICQIHWMLPVHGPYSCFISFLNQKKNFFFFAALYSM